MTKEKRTYQPITSENICHAYELLLNNGLVSFPLTNEAKNKVDAIVSNIDGVYYGREIYSTVEEKAVAYLYFLIKGHPFVDGNKRTASLVFEVFSEVNDLTPDFKDFTLDELAVFVEQIQESDHHEVIKIIAEVIFKTTS